jgi:preprotein translocase subunit SecA
MATITLQNYFRLYDKLAGMTGTAKTEEKEFSEIYGLHVAEIPTNEPVAREDRNDLIYRTQEAKFAAALDDIAERHEEGQPVLVGTIAVETSEYLSQLLTRRGIPHNVLNAKQHEREAEVIAQAGRKGSVTIATNMAGRGVDIVLGGNKQYEIRRELIAEGSEEGSEDFDAELKRRMDEARAEWEADHEDVLELGGLYVVGTERHEARRIDNQLRGRSGRQGDPGETRFFLSGQDDLVRLFAGDRIQNIMARFKVPEDQPMEAGILTKQIENAQKKVEEQNFVMRKNVLKYDDVMNKQRTVIYEQRRAVLEGQDLSDEVRQWIEEVVEGAVDQFATEEGEGWDLNLLCEAMHTLYGSDVTADELREDFSGSFDRQALVDDFSEDAQEAYAEKERQLGTELLRELERYVILQVVDTRWREHLESMDYLREGVHLRAMAQKDPLVEYTQEGHQMFEELGRAIREEVVFTLFHAELAPDAAADLTPQEAPTVDGGLAYSHESMAGSDAISAAFGGNGEGELVAIPRTEQRVVAEKEKLGRNDPCWCGSGKKYKKCHGA